jgi:hypothetical protein
LLFQTRQRLPKECEMLVSQSFRECIGVVLNRVKSEPILPRFERRGLDQRGFAGDRARLPRVNALCI